MPISIDPPPADDELECGRCGAHFHYELTRCPNCGVSVFGSEADEDTPDRVLPSVRARRRDGLGARATAFLRRLTRQPDPADELFGAAVDQAQLFDALLSKVAGDRAAAERLVDYERSVAPAGNRLAWIGAAIHRWERDNRVSGAPR